MAHGAASFAFKKTAPVSRTTLSVSDRTSIGSFPFVCWCDPSKFWCLGQHTESLGHCLWRRSLAYSTTGVIVIVALRTGKHDAFRSGIQYGGLIYGRGRRGGRRRIAQARRGVRDDPNARITGGDLRGADSGHQGQAAGDGGWPGARGPRQRSGRARGPRVVVSAVGP